MEDLSFTAAAAEAAGNAIQHIFVENMNDIDNPANNKPLSRWTLMSLFAVVQTVSGYMFYRDLPKLISPRRFYTTKPRTLSQPKCAAVYQLPGDEFTYLYPAVIRTNLAAFSKTPTSISESSPSSCIPVAEPSISWCNILWSLISIIPYSSLSGLLSEYLNQLIIYLIYVELEKVTSVICEHLTALLMALVSGVHPSRQFHSLFLKKYGSAKVKNVLSPINAYAMCLIKSALTHFLPPVHLLTSTWDSQISLIKANPSLLSFLCTPETVIRRFARIHNAFDASQVHSQRGVQISMKSIAEYHSALANMHRKRMDYEDAQKAFNEEFKLISSTGINVMRKSVTFTPKVLNTYKNNTSIFGFTMFALDDYAIIPNMYGFNSEIERISRKVQSLQRDYFLYSKEPENSRRMLKMENSLMQSIIKDTEVIQDFAEKIQCAMGLKWHPKSLYDIEQVEMSILFCRYYCKTRNVVETCRFLEKEKRGALAAVFELFEKLSNLELASKRLVSECEELVAEMAPGECKWLVLNKIHKFTELMDQFNSVTAEAADFKYFDYVEVLKHVNIDSLQKQVYWHLHHNLTYVGDHPLVDKYLQRLRYKL